MELEAVRSSLSGKEVKNNWIYISAISYTFVACTGTTLLLHFFSLGATTPIGGLFYSPLAGYSLLADEVF